MYKLKITIFIGICIILCWSTTCFARGDLPNDGKVKENPYGDSGLPSSFDTGEYYDCAVPYNVTLEEIGGYSVEVIAQFGNSYGVLAPSSYSNKVGGYVNYEWDGNRTFGCSDSKIEASTGARVLTKNGVDFYVTAVQGFFYNYEKAGSNGYGAHGDSSASCIGQVIDVILTDGTCIHFICGDFNSDNHTNGGPMENPLREVQWRFSNVNYKQYNNLYAASSGNLLEIWGESGCASKVQSKYNIGQGDDQNRIAYYRMYNLNTNTDYFSAVGSDAKNVSYNLGKISSNSTGGNSNSGIGIIEETTESGLKDYQDYISTEDGSNLSLEELYNIHEMGENIEVYKQYKRIKFLKNCVMFIGLSLIVYAISVWVGLLIDKIVGPFIDISIIKFLTFGLMDYDSSSQRYYRGGKYQSTGRIVLGMIVVVLIGCVIISGFAMGILGKVLVEVGENLL